MRYKAVDKKQRKEKRRPLLFFISSLQGGGRLTWLMGGLITLGILMLGQLFNVSILQYGFYSALAQDQHVIYRTLVPERGDILAKDKDGVVYTLATQKEFFHVYVVPHEVQDARDIADVFYDHVYPEIEEEEEEETKEGEETEPLSKEERKRLAELEEQLRKKQYNELVARLSKEGDPYEPLLDRVPKEVKEELAAHDLEGVYFLPKKYRFYPEKEYASHLIGFLKKNDEGIPVGQYGIEGYFDEELAGTYGHIHTEQDASGRWITLAEKQLVRARDGQDVVLTVDKHIQYEACESLYKAAERHQVERGSVTIMDPKTGAILSMCSYPFFDSNAFGEAEDIEVYNNTGTFYPYEPGSIFKGVTMALALDADVITPETTYDDQGEILIGQYTIKNSDKKAHGISTMVEVLEKSLNLGTIFASYRLGNEAFVEGVHSFGFGEKTDLTIDFEAKGHLGRLDEARDIFTATASYGQGIMVTPLQILSAYGALANGGTLMHPYIVEGLYDKGEQTFASEPREKRRVISEKTSALVSGMLVSVIENGHAVNAQVPGYYLAGKTGTAQVASSRGGYEKDKTIHSFVGYGPIDDPRFVMIVRLDHPKDAKFSSETAAPLFSEVASYILQYYEVPKDY